MRAALLEHFQRLEHFPAQAQRLLVDDEDVRVEHIRRVFDDGGAHHQRLFNVDVQIQWRVFAIAQLHHARHTHEIDARTEIETADDR